jgi:hypothetical protein
MYPVHTYTIFVFGAFPLQILLLLGLSSRYIIKLSSQTSNTSESFFLIPTPTLLIGRVLRAVTELTRILITNKLRNSQTTQLSLTFDMMGTAIHIILICVKRGCYSYPLSLSITSASEVRSILFGRV